MLNTEKYVNFILDNNLTQTQFLLLILVKEKRSDLIRKYRERFPTDDGSMCGSYLTKDLMKKGFLIEKKVRGVTTYSIGKAFLDAFIDEVVATDDIYNAYPNFYEKENGVSIPLTSMDRNVFGRIYLDKIHYSTDEHLEILKDIEYGKENNLLNIGIEKFLKSEFWKSIRVKRLNKDSNENIVNDNYEDF